MVLIKALVLTGHKCLGHIGAHIVHVHPNAVFFPMQAGDLHSLAVLVCAVDERGHILAVLLLGQIKDLVAMNHAVTVNKQHGAAHNAHHANNHQAAQQHLA